MVAEERPWNKLLLDLMDHMDFKNPNIRYPNKENKYF